MLSLICDIMTVILSYVEIHNFKVILKFNWIKYLLKFQY